MSPKPLQTNWRSPKSVNYERMAERGWLDDGILLIDRNDERLNWDYRKMVEMIGNHLYGERLPREVE